MKELLILLCLLGPCANTDTTKDSLRMVEEMTQRIKDEPKLVDGTTHMFKIGHRFTGFGVYEGEIEVGPVYEECLGEELPEGPGVSRVYSFALIKKDGSWRSITVTNEILAKEMRMKAVEIVREYLAEEQIRRNVNTHGPEEPKPWLVKEKNNRN